MKKTRHNARLFNLYKKDNHCYWCGRITVLIGKRMPNQATLDHVKQEDSWAPGKLTRYRVPRVLACYKCNHERSKKGL